MPRWWSESQARLRWLALDAEDILLVDAETQGAAMGSAGENRQVAILFADIRNFTALSEAQLPYDVVHALNRYFDSAGSIIYVVGPPAMVEAMRRTLADAGVAADKIRTEEFYGY